jgi:hypothetical protein
MIQTPSEIQCSKIEFGPVKVLDNGGKTVNLRYEGRNLMVETPSVGLPYGVNVFDKNGPPKYSVDLSLRGADDNDQVRALQDFLEAFDERMIDAGVENASKWFKMANPSREVIKAFYTPSVRFSKDAEGNLKPYPPTLKIQLKQREGKFETAVYDEKKRPLSDIPLEDILVKGATISSLIQCTGVWFAGSKFGLSWKAMQIKADHLPESIRGFAFRDEDEPATRVAVPPPAPPAPSSNSFSALDDEDEMVNDEAALAPSKTVVTPPTAEDDDEADIVEPVAVPKKPTVTTVKKVVKAVVKK